MPHISRLLFRLVRLAGMGKRHRDAYSRRVVFHYLSPETRAQAMPPRAPEEGDEGTSASPKLRTSAPHLVSEIKRMRAVEAG